MISRRHKISSILSFHLIPSLLTFLLLLSIITNQFQILAQQNSDAPAEDPPSDKVIGKSSHKNTIEGAGGRLKFTYQTLVD